MRFFYLLSFLIIVSFSVVRATDIKTEILSINNGFYSDEQLQAKVKISNVNILVADKIDLILTILNSNGFQVYNETKVINDLQPDLSNTYDFNIDWSYGFGNFSVKFDAQFSDEINPTNNIATSQLSVKVGYTDAGNLVLDYFKTIYSDDDLALALGYQFSDPFDEGAIITDFSKKYQYTLENESWVGFLDINPNLGFSHPAYTTYVNTTTGVVMADMTGWWPISQDGNNPIRDNNRIIGDPNQPLQINIPSNWISQVRSDSVKGDSICVLMVTGYDPNQKVRNNWKNNCERLKDELTKEVLGPGIPSSRIEIVEQISGQDLINKIRLMRGKCKEIYFYYAGHGELENMICTGIDKTQWINYDDLFTELYDTQAKDLNVIIENCFSGQAIASAKKFPEWSQRNIQVLTASDASNPSYNINLGNNQTGFSWYSALLAQGLGNPAADANKDGRTSLIEAHLWVIAQDASFSWQGNVTKINDFQKPLGESNIDNTPETDLEKIANIFKLALDETYNPAQLQNTTGYLHPEKLPSGTVIRGAQKQSPDPDSEINKTEITLESDSYFAWADLDKYSKFGHLTAYVTIDPITEKYQIYESDWWPEVVDDNSYQPFDTSTTVYGSNEFYRQMVPDTANLGQQAEQVPRDSVCALIISGEDDERKVVEDAFKLDAEMFANNLKMEKLGANLSDGNVRVEHKPGFDKLDNILVSMKGNYKKVYFYYSGHGTSSGVLGVGDQWMSQKWLLRRLMEINAEEYCIVIDACYAGIAKDLLDSVDIPEGSTVELITSSDKDKISYSDFHRSGDIKIGFGLFTLNFLRCYGFPDADTDNDGKTSFSEAYNWFKKVNPSDLSGKNVDSLMNSTHTVRKRPIVSPQAPSANVREAGVSINFKEISSDLQLEFKSEYAKFDYGDNLHNSIKFVTDDELNSILLKIKAPVNATFKADLILDYKDYLQPLPTSEGLQIGFITRKESNDAWMPHFPSIYDKAKSTITAIDVSGFSQWAIATVEIPSAVKQYRNSGNLVAYPNPFADMITIDFVAEGTENLNFRIYSITGALMDDFRNVHLNSGTYQLILDGNKYQPGAYYIEILGSKTKEVVSIIKN